MRMWRVCYCYVNARCNNRGDCSKRAAGSTTLSAQIPEADRRWGTLMVAAQAGDRITYETLLQECIPFIKTVARRQGVSLDRIDDVVQETLITVHRARQTYD